MKFLVVGLSPYLVSSKAILTADIMKYLLFEGHKVAGAVYGHDAQFFVPDKTDDGKELHYYKFGDPEIKIPLSIFSHRENTPVAIYEIINSLQPDVVITVGDYKDYLYMKAVKMFQRDIKWFAIFTNHLSPINEENRELFEEADGILCTSRFAQQTVRNIFEKELIDTHFVGAHSEYTTKTDGDSRTDKFRVMTCNKVTQSDQLAAIIEAIAIARQQAPDIELYLHSNIYDNGDYDVNQLKDQFDPENEFIILPDQYISIYEGIPHQELCSRMQDADLFLSISMTSGTAMSVFDALAAGCYPLMSDCGAHKDLAEDLSMGLENSDYTMQDFLVPCTRLMDRDGSYMKICDPDILSEKVLSIYRNKKKHEGMRQKFAQFTNSRGRKQFLRRLSEMLTEIKDTNSVYLETV